MARLLIVDDEEQVSTALAMLLRHEGHEAFCANCAGDALFQLQHNRPDLVLLDLMMPDVDGLDLLDAIEEDSRFFDVPVAVLSARSDDEAIVKARKLGACDYIVKGMDWDHTYAKIRQHLPAEEPGEGELVMPAVVPPSPAPN
jgi:DNA-binding response OmpR family regulator